MIMQTPFARSCRGFTLAALTPILASAGCTSDVADPTDPTDPTDSIVAAPSPTMCTDLAFGNDPTQPLLVDSCKLVHANDAPYVYEYVNVVEGGELRFVDKGKHTDFRAKSILVERGGTLRAGDATASFGSAGGTLDIGIYGDDPSAEGSVNPPSEPGIQCVGDGGLCYPATAEGSVCDAASVAIDPTDPCKTDPGSETKFNNAVFEPYGEMAFDGNQFGFKTFAISYGGSLELHGFKGVGNPAPDTTLDKTVGQCDTPANDPSSPVDSAKDHNDVQKWANYSGNSWGRVSQQAADNASLTVDRPVTWEKGDKIIVGTNDWEVGHSEVATLADDADSAGKLTLVTDGKNPLNPSEDIEYHEGQSLQHDHNGSIVTVDSTADGSKTDSVEGRAAVGLLTRSIRIRSLGKTATDEFPEASGDCAIGADGKAAASCYFGAHTIVRQGFANFHVEGVEFYQLGQGGRMGHYPVHFHKTKDTAYTDAYVRDSSIWDSMTRFVTIHATHGVEISRNVGHLSVGHAFFLEDGSEINNRLCHNLGVSTRPSIKEFFEGQASGSRTERFVPPIMARMADWSLPGADSVYPSMFWMMNAYNDFVGNAAVGVGGFGACYWPLSSSVSGASRKMKWANEDPYNDSPLDYRTNSPLDYANFNTHGGRQAPFKSFIGNSCQNAAYAFMTERSSLQPGRDLIDDPADLTKSNLHFDKAPNVGVPAETITPINNPYYANTDVLDPLPFAADPHNAGAPWHPDYTQGSKTMLPLVGGTFNPMKYADADRSPGCSVVEVNPIQEEQNAKGCVTTVIDRFSTRYNWPQTNFAAIWLRPWNYLFVNGAVSDQLYGGLGFISGGSPEQALPFYLAMAKDSLFLGTLSTEDGAQKGPNLTDFDCQSGANKYCWNWTGGTGLYVGDFQPKRLITIYDGPFFADGNTFGHVGPWDCDPHGPTEGLKNCGVYKASNQPMVSEEGTVPDPTTAAMHVIDAAIGWKQPNGFYYPPAFAFRNTHFLPKTDTRPATERHNVLDPSHYYFSGSALGEVVGNTLFGSSTSLPDTPGFTRRDGVTPIDFTTILNDLDGTLNGVRPSSGDSPRTVGVSNNFFYATPGEDVECNSFGTNTVPHDFISTFVARMNGSNIDTTWRGTPNDPPADPRYPLVPIYRQFQDPAFQGEACTDVAPVCNADGTWGCDRGSFLLGTNTGMAPGLTINNGLYYIDTNTTTQNSACVFDPAKVNPGFSLPTFEQGKEYAVFDLYTTPETEITYQIYVGTGVSDPSAAVKFIRVNVHSGGANYATTPWNPMGAGAPTVGWAQLPDGSASTTVLEVTMKTTALEDDFKFDGTDAATACRPADICQLNSGGDGCTVNDAFAGTPIADAVTEVCEKWVSVFNGVDVEGVFLADCPRGGCPGFVFTMGTAEAADTYEKVGLPLSEPFPTTAPWDKKLTTYPAGSECAGNDG